MPLIVQKFGGTSVADSQMILAAARKAIRAQQEGNRVVMVVSAMGSNTDQLSALAREVSEAPPAREMDMLLSTGEQVSVALMAMAIDSLGYKAVSLTGAQIGIKTDSSHTKARIQSISTERIQKLLDEGWIVIAAGFQGIDENFNITTLGRGGSDTTAVALAAVLQADACEIYTDVDGVYTTDPRVLPEARIVSQVSYDEMLELASLGAGVMHSRSIEFAKKFDVPILVRSSLSDVKGSYIADQVESKDVAVSGAALTKDEARVSIRGVPDIPGTSFKIFSKVSDQNITVDMIVQNVAEDGLADISFTIPRDELRQTCRAIEEEVVSLGGTIDSHDDNVSKVSVVGLGMAQQTGVADRLFRGLADIDVNLDMITTSEIKISVLVARDQALAAIRRAHQAFELERQPPNRVPQLDPTERNARRADAIDVIDRLRGVGMESLMIDEISLDDSQARISINHVPNRPGVACEVFEQIAAHDIFVDMIIQSYAGDNWADLSLTVPREQLEAGIGVLKGLRERFQDASISHNTGIAKLSVSGIGLRSHTGVAVGTFRALAEKNINVEMINTSEVRVNVVVDSRYGKLALQALKDEFADSIR